MNEAIIGDGLVDHVHHDFYYYSKSALSVKKIFEILLMGILLDQRDVFIEPSAVYLLSGQDYRTRLLNGSSKT